MKNRIIHLTFYFIIFLTALQAAHSFSNYVIANIAIREAFFFENDIKNKGTHWGGEKYLLLLRNYKIKILKFQFRDILESFQKNKTINLLETSFKKEYDIVSILYELSDLPNDYKKNTILYIPKTLKTYWDMSCDTHMTPFLGPGIANIAMLEGLPLLNNSNNSCFTHLLEYGYNYYYTVGKQARYLELSPDKLCKRAEKEGFIRVIEITENDVGDIITITHECTSPD